MRERSSREAKVGAKVGTRNTQRTMHEGLRRGLVGQLALVVLGCHMVQSRFPSRESSLSHS